LAGRAVSAARRAPSALERSEGALGSRAVRLEVLAVGQLDRRDEQVRGWRRLLAAYDVDRQLERGYSLTLTSDGSLLRRAADVAPGQEIVTRLADGSVRSTVDAVDALDAERVDVESNGTDEDGAA
jgi:exodeoxyribonuclease VII large subunit